MNFQNFEEWKLKTRKLNKGKRLQQGDYVKVAYWKKIEDCRVLCAPSPTTVYLLNSNGQILPICNSNQNWKDYIRIVGKKAKLPKQWKYWVKKYNFGLYKPGRYSQSDFRADDFCYLHKSGYRYRVNRLGLIDKSCREEDFDRWANSTESNLGEIPQTELEFTKTFGLKYRGKRYANE